MDEGRGLDQDLGLLAHGLAVPGDGDVDGRHGSGRHHRNLPESETGLELPGPDPQERLANTCLHRTAVRWRRSSFHYNIKPNVS